MRELLRSNKNGIQLAVDGFIYEKKRITGDTQLWNVLKEIAKLQEFLTYILN
jgi:hypothetical protein